MKFSSFSEIQAKQDSSANSIINSGDKKGGFRGVEDVPGVVKDELAQKGGTAMLPCKLSDPNAGIVSTTIPRIPFT